MIDTHFKFTYSYCCICFILFNVWCCLLVQQMFISITGYQMCTQICSGIQGLATLSITFSFLWTRGWEPKVCLTTMNLTLSPTGESNCPTLTMNWMIFWRRSPQRKRMRKNLTRRENLLVLKMHRNLVRVMTNTEQSGVNVSYLNLQRCFVFGGHCDFSFTVLHDCWSCFH